MLPWLAHINKLQWRRNCVKDCMDGMTVVWEPAGMFLNYVTPMFRCLARLVAAGSGLKCAKCSQRAAGQAVGTPEGFVGIHVAGAVSGTIIPAEDPVRVRECIHGSAAALPHAVAAQPIRGGPRGWIPNGHGFRGTALSE